MRQKAGRSEDDAPASYGPDKYVERWEECLRQKVPNGLGIQVFHCEEKAARVLQLAQTTLKNEVRP